MRLPEALGAYSMRGQFFSLSDREEDAGNIAQGRRACVHFSPTLPEECLGERDLSVDELSKSDFFFAFWYFTIFLNLSLIYMSQSLT